MAVVKSELIKQLKKSYPNFEKKLLNKIVEIIIKEIVNSLKRSESCEFRGFGRFSTKIQKPSIRRNPKIFFRNKGPNFDKLLSLQENMLEKASFLLNTNGFIIYMTCSFLQIETINQIDRFLKLNNNFMLSNFKLKENKKNYSKFIKNNFMITVPNMIFDYNIDGYFAVFLKKIK